LDGTPETIYISNCTDLDYVEINLSGAKSGRYQLENYDNHLRLLARAVRNFGEPFFISEEVPQGGLLKLRRLED
jgi:hypothetical protein